MQVFPKWHDIFHELFNPTFLTTTFWFCLDHMHTLTSDDLALNCICRYPCLHTFAALKADVHAACPTVRAQNFRHSIRPAMLHYMRSRRG